MPVYEFRCDRCARSCDLLLDLGDTANRPCPECADGTLRRRFSRVAVRYAAWGFNATDRLSRQPGRRDFRRLRETAEKIADE